MPESGLHPLSSMPFSQAAGKMEHSHIVELWEMGFGRDNVIPLWVGEGDLPTPRFIIDATHQALLEGHCFYGPKRGIPELRSAFSDYYRRHYGLSLDSERFSITSSGMNAVVVALQAVVSPGDRVVIVAPVWPNVVYAAKLVGGEPVSVGLKPREDGGFKLDLNELFAACDERTKAIFIVTPSNPTGWIISEEEQRALLDFCRRRRIWLIGDEVYHRFVYDDQDGGKDGTRVAPSFLQVAEEEDPLFIINSFSKAWAMTGWRMGWLTHPGSVGGLISDLIEYNTSGAQPFLQWGCLAALRDGEAFVKDYIARCGKAAKILYEGLSSYPRVRIARPQASFYSFFAVEGVSNSLDFCKDVLEKTGVGLAPGTAFGPQGEGHVRLCFASSPERIAEAVERLEPVLK